MKQLLKRLRHHIKALKPAPEPLITITVSKVALLNNLAYFAAKTPHGNIAPVLKSNAYGHGLILVAKILEKAPPIPFFVVDSYFEAMTLRNEGIRKPLVIIGYTQTQTIQQNRLKHIAFTVTNLLSLKKIALQKIRCTIHLKIDTGMHRQGILPTEIPEAISIIKQNLIITLEGIASHLADADSTDTAFTKKQITLWNTIVKNFKTEFPDLKYWHLSNTAGNTFAEDIDANVSRIGFGLYMSPQPVLEMKTIITGIKSIRAGEKVGYSGTFTAQKDMTIGIIPIGYYEALPVSLANKGCVKITANNNVYIAPIIGRVNMNMTIVDLSEISDIALETPVTVISSNPLDHNSTTAIAKTAGTIPYEILVHIPAHLKRIQIT